MKSIILVCQDSMINKIFMLVAKKLSFEIKIYTEFSKIDTEYDCIIIDDGIVFDYNLIEPNAYSVLLLRLIHYLSI